MTTEYGVGGVSWSHEHSGSQLEPLPDYVALFPGFNPGRARSALDLIDESLLVENKGSVLWILGLPHLPENQWRTDAMRHINRLTEDSHCALISTFQYKDTVRELTRVYDQQAGKSNVTVCPMGSKLQAVGSALFLVVHPDVRVVLSRPGGVNSRNYSKGCKALWQLRLGRTTALRGELKKTGRIELRLHADVSELDSDNGTGVPGRKLWLRSGEVLHLTESGISLTFEPPAPSSTANRRAFWPGLVCRATSKWLLAGCRVVPR